MYRRAGGGGLEVFLVHPGGPFFARKDEGVWTIPKGEPALDEEAHQAVARREFEEETGITPPKPGGGRYVPLGRVRQRGGKYVVAWAFEGEWSGVLRSNAFVMEWPPKSGKKQAFPEVDRAAFFPVEEARLKMNPAQWTFLERLLEHLAGHKS